jgi:hypothetical protein
MDSRHALDARVALIAALITGSAVQGCSEPSPRRDAQRESSMDDLLHALDRHADVAVTVRQGTEHFDNGLITLVVRGDGSAIVEQLASGAKQVYTAKLDATHLAALGSTLTAHRFTAVRTTTLPRKPGDTQLVLRLDRGGTQLFQAELWDADRYKDADLDAILRTADALIHEVSGGKLGQAAR